MRRKYEHSKKKNILKSNRSWFKKGCYPIGGFKKGHIPWNKGKKLSIEIKKKISHTLRGYGFGRWCWKSKNWSNMVMKRDNFTCKSCGSLKNLIAHHIVEWKNSVKKRFMISNGTTLCRSCHSRLHASGRKHTSSTKKKISLSNKGRTSWNSGKKLSIEHRKKLSESHKNKNGCV